MQLKMTEFFSSSPYPYQMSVHSTKAAEKNTKYFSNEKNVSLQVVCLSALIIFPMIDLVVQKNLYLNWQYSVLNRG